jgi:uncharacterized protein (TIGR02246 family)
MQLALAHDPMNELTHPRSMLNGFTDRTFEPSLIESARGLPMTEDERQIRELIKAWMALSSAGDVSAVLDLMTDDVVFLTPGRLPFGKEAFAAEGAKHHDVAMEGSSDIQELVIAGNLAFSRSFIQITLTRTGEAPRRMAGYALSVFRKEADQRWRLARDANLVGPAG